MKYFIGIAKVVLSSVLGIVSSGSMLGCASLDSQREGGEVRHYFGYVKIENSPNKLGKIAAENVFFVGAKISQGIEIGASKSQLLSIPLDCRTVILVQNKVQLQEAVYTISKFGLDNICASEF